MFGIKPNFTIMKNFKVYRSKIVIVSVLVAITFCFQKTQAQDISVYQYRNVPNDKVNEFVKRETTYWSEVAQKAVDNGKLKFWALFQKVGGYDLENSSNFLFVNTFADIDDTGGIWEAEAVFPDVAMEDMETFSMGHVTSMIYVKSHHWEQAADASPENDFKYVTFVYHNANNPIGLVEAEKEIWGPFIKSAMDNDQTTQRAWGNARILSPTGEEIKYNTISFDIYPNLKGALDPGWTDLEVPDMTKIEEAEGNRRASVVYRIVKVVSANE
jgi:hypothetical protein